MAEHPIWSMLVFACVAWYSLVTCYVAVRGFVDIGQMLGKLKEDHAELGDGQDGSHE